MCDKQDSRARSVGFMYLPLLVVNVDLPPIIALPVKIQLPPYFLSLVYSELHLCLTLADTSSNTYILLRTPSQPLGQNEVA